MPGGAATVADAVELRVERGRPLFVELDGRLGLKPEHVGISPALCAVLYEWAEVVERVVRGEIADKRAVETVARRGERLAGRVADEFGREVRYRDPLTGERRAVPAPRGDSLSPGSDPRREVTDPAARPTGLAVSVSLAALVAVVLVVVSLGLGEVNPVLGVVINVAIAGGLAPSVWLGRSVPTWRWVAFGVVLGVGASWVVLPLSLLG
ncbi:Protein of unknown function [Actinopolyspora xinjiangensis]|uniref:DUF2537 domain-containing protein n=1 Tax=Actinopolyspora xinjiangensis TaxID=405564 RepID=A0A1H0P277_9ACTN|nr:DUF2537 domain-containing protein [Actinopolyspora xinjiangensis]SDO98760.1 Protein of unknown function [Actinopolyspora xinjiangensis]